MRILKCKLMRFVAAVMAFAMTAAMTGCGDGSEQETQPTGNETVSYTLTVTNRAGTPMEKCRVEIYSDASKSAQLFKGISDANGQIQFAAPTSDKYVAVISKVPTGYHVEDQYPVAGESTNIVLSPGVMTEADMDSVKFSLGDAMLDFTVTLPDESTIVLSELLQEKKAVVLNFWYLGCAPCKMEFPYIQEGYEQLSEDIAILALNPIDGTAAEVAEFQSTNGYTFTMSKCDGRWHDMLKKPSYPTTLVVDRYGNICLIHTGGLESTQEFLDMVGYFIQDDYQQRFFKSIGQIPTAS